MTAVYGIEERYPLHDKRIIEFSLALPPDFHLFHPYKTILIETQNRLHPGHSIIEFLDPDASDTIIKTIVLCGGRQSYENLSLAKQGLVVQEEILKLYDKAFHWYETNDTSYTLVSTLLWNVIVIESWYDIIQ